VLPETSSKIRQTDFAGISTPNRRCVRVAGGATFVCAIFAYAVFTSVDWPSRRDIMM
jgi:hypothetical protein